jgi:predicted RNase H-like nuclease (RuvC/YqgF family)
MVKLTNMENEKMNTNKTYSQEEINKAVDEYKTKKEADFSSKFNSCADTIGELKKELDYTNYLREKLENKFKENQAMMEKNSKYVGVYSKLEEQNEKINLKITKLQFVADQIESTLTSLVNVWQKLYIYQEAHEEAFDELI